MAKRKDPAFLFYPADWIGGTMGMTFEEKGAYMELLMLQFNRGHMTYDMMAHTVGQLLDKVLVKFQKDDDGLYFNPRLEEEKIKRKAFTDSRLNNINGKNQYSKKGGHMGNHMINVNYNKELESLNNLRKAVKFSEDGEFAIFEDGSKQKLGKLQKVRMMHSDLKPEDVLSGVIV